MSAPIDRVLDRLDGVRATGEHQHEARCPAHPDRRASLAIGEGADGRVLISCHAGCEFDAILAAMGLQKRDLFPDGGNGNAHTPAAPPNVDPEAVAAKAAGIWESATLCGPNGHPYLTRKGIKPHGARLYHDALVLPVQTLDGDIRGLQFIDADGTKRFLTGTTKRGHCYTMGNLDDAETVLLAEGFATAASLREASGYPAVVCFDCGNLSHVATAVRERYPDVDIVLCGDNDRSTPGNPGAAAARRAAEAVGGRLALPEFANGEPGSDFNDLAAARGLEAVAAAVEGAACPEPAQGRELVEDPAPLRLAELFVAQEHTEAGRVLLRRVDSEWFTYARTHYRVEPAEGLRAALARWLDGKDHLAKRGNKLTRVPLVVTPRRCSDVIDLLPAVPGVLYRTRPDDEGWVALGNGLLHLERREFRPHCPSIWRTFALPFDYDPAAPDPAHWQQFLGDIFGARADEVRLLQQWFGYCLTGQTRLQKALMLIGPKRSGKGTCARTLRALLGPDAVAAPTLASLGTPFGLQSLIGKRLAIIGDARLSGRTDTAVVVERLLSITGEDAQTVPRKYATDWHGTLPARFMLLSNELPRVADAAGAFASRFLILRLTRSFYGAEDTRLTEKLSTELPGIFNWALHGLADLQQSGRFHEPESSVAEREDLEDLGSPVGAFIRDQCSTEPWDSVSVDLLYERWKSWCASKGRDRPGTVQTLCRDIRSIVPGVATKQPRDGGRRLRVLEGIGLLDNAENH